MTSDQAAFTRESHLGRAAGRAGSGRCIAVAVVAVLAAASVAGCAGPGGISGLARGDDEQALREAVAADRFPTAAELGIVAGATDPARKPNVGP